MFAFWCFTSMGLVLSLKYKAQREHERAYRPSLLERERMLDEENKQLDREIEALLLNYKSLIERGT